MRQFILPDFYNGESFLSLEGDNFHYLCKVLRKNEGSSFPGLDKNGNRWLLTIKKINHNSCLLKISPSIKKEENTPEITLVQCLPKGKKMDLIIRQAVESGIKRIIPVMSDHAIPKFDNQKDIEKKRTRWKKIAIEAMQQSGSVKIPEIKKMILIDQIPKIWNNCGLSLFCHQNRIADNSLHDCLNEKTDHICIIIGPEGGLSDREVVLLQNAGFKSVFLGNNVLRTETAALYTTAAVNVILMEKNRWNLNLPIAE